jgi:hypothetical protein
MQERKRFMTRWLAWFCLSLTLWTAVVESTHNHLHKTQSSPCSICVVAHSSSPAPSCNHPAPVFAAVGLLQDEEVSAKIWVGVFDLGIRGPPVA